MFDKVLPIIVICCQFGNIFKAGENGVPRDLKEATRRLCCKTIMSFAILCQDNILI